MILYKVNVRLRRPMQDNEIKPLIKYGGMMEGYGEFFFLTEKKDRELVFCRVSDINCKANQNLLRYLRFMCVPFEKFKEEQICVSEFAGRLHHGNEENLCAEPLDVLRKYSMLPYIHAPFEKCIGEGEIETGTRAEIRKNCREIYSASLREEVERIFAGNEIEFRGHPVLYSIVTDSWKKNEQVLDVLLPALHRCGRLPAERITMLKPCAHPLPESALSDIYQAQNGATVVVGFTDCERTDESEEALHAIERLAREYRDTVLTVFCACAENENALRTLREVTRELPVLKLKEDRLTARQAKQALSAKAKAAGFDAAFFLKKLPAGRSSYSTRDVEKIFCEWQDEYYCTELYSNYAGVVHKNQKPAARESTTATEELRSLVGLTEVKKIISEVIDYAGMQKLCRDRGIPCEPPHMHMVFTGNPGTAKTTVARLTARILKECGVLSVGDLVEVGRSDLIGKYVGWTAKQVKDAFRRAEGSVLFIDEAYSLLDDKENQFGDEAINTIVQEMENHRNSTVVIFAGYSEPMERFLERNPGLRSRVSYQIEFPDYSEAELLDIVRLVLTEKYRTVLPETEESIRGLLRDGMKSPNFGNGRYARKIVEQAMLRQASRLAAMPAELISDAEIYSLTAADFTVDGGEKKTASPQERKIGFAI